MGRATIVSELGEGLYLVDIDVGTDRKNALITKFQRVAASANEGIARLTDQRTQARNELIEARNDLNDNISFLVAEQAAGQVKPETEKKVAESREKVTEKTDQLEQIESLLSQEEARLKEAQENIARLSSIDSVLRKQVWCIDYSEGLSGTVATYEINGRIDEVVIAEGGRSPSSDDGRFLLPDFMSPSQAYFNTAIFDAWQKFKPTARVGTIVSIDEDNNRLRVSFGDDRSYYRDININSEVGARTFSTNYMGAGVLTFETGDDVIVTFDNQDYSQGRIKGYRTNPRPLTKWAYFMNLGYKCPISAIWWYHRNKSEMDQAYQPGLESFDYTTPYTHTFLSGAVFGVNNYWKPVQSVWQGARREAYSFPYICRPDWLAQYISRADRDFFHLMYDGHEITQLRLRGDVAIKLRENPSAYRFEVDGRGEGNLLFQQRRTIPYTTTNLSNTDDIQGTCFADEYGLAPDDGIIRPMSNVSGAWGTATLTTPWQCANLQAIVYHYDTGESHVRFFLNPNHAGQFQKTIFYDGSLARIPFWGHRDTASLENDSYYIKCTADEKDEELYFRFNEAMTAMQVDDDSERQDLDFDLRYGKTSEDGIINYKAGLPEGTVKHEADSGCRGGSTDWDNAIEWVDYDG